jgi:predicted  nucleic acid-binding Zn-ribbon protein
MNLDKILEYQKIDQEIYRLELDLFRSKEAARINNVKSQLGNVEAALLRLNKETEDLFRAIEGFEREISAAFPDKSITDGVNTLEKIETAEQALNACLENLSNIEKESKKIFDRLNSISKEASKQYDTGMYLSGELRKAKEEYGALYNKIKTENKDNFARLNELNADIDPALMARYKTIRDNRKMPAIVAYVNGNCSACGIDISIEVGEKLKNPGDIAECPSCRRLVYHK